MKYLAVISLVVSTLYAIKGHYDAGAWSLLMGILYVQIVSDGRK